MSLDAFVVMPNHVHGIIVVNDGCGYVRGGVGHESDPGGVAGGGGGRSGVQLNAATTSATTNPFSEMFPRANTLSVIVRTYKAAVTTECRRKGRFDFAWQRNYYEHIIRNEDDVLSRVRQYMLENPLRWALDAENPDVRRRA